MYQIAGGREIEGKTSTEISSQEIVPLEIPEEDILLVAQQANVSIDVARKALEDSEGDLAQAIIKLQTR
jgi:nascent polypeptide-associated complex subunit alpha